MHDCHAFEFTVRPLLALRVTIIVLLEPFLFQQWLADASGCIIDRQCLSAGEVVVRPAWGKDQPNNYNGEQNCVVLDGGRGWLWNDVGCNLDYLHWVCMHSE